MMFDLLCTGCRRRYLVGAHGLRGLQNVAPGVIVLDLVCPRGHEVLVITGALQTPR